MADLPTSTETKIEPTQAEQNADVARKLAEQDINSKSTATIDTHTGSALDALAAQVTKKADEVTAEATEKAEAAAAAAKAKADEEKAKADAEKAAKEAGTPPAAEVPPVVEEEDPAKKVAELFKDSPTLPPGASPKSSEAFSAVKVKAAQEITARDKRILELEEQIKQRDEKLKNPVPPEMHKELEDLRSFRAKLDIEADPKFKAFDTTIASSQEFIYSQLLKSPAINQEVIDQIKKLGGPEMVDLEKIFATVKDPTIQRIVEAKIADIEQAKWQKDQAIKTTKANVSDYVKKREEEFTKSATAHTDATREAMTELSAKALTWMATRKADAKADEATKKAVEDHNKFVTDVKGQLEAALSDDSPRMRAILMIATAQLLQLQRTHASAATKLAQLEKENKELTEKLDKFKNASVSRLRESQANANGKTPVVAPATINTHTGDAVDKIRDQIMQERARATA